MKFLKTDWEYWVLDYNLFPDPTYIEEGIKDITKEQMAHDHAHDGGILEDFGESYIEKYYGEINGRYIACVVYRSPIFDADFYYEIFPFVAHQEKPLTYEIEEAVDSSIPDFLDAIKDLLDVGA